jgi:hypothetical protein
MNSPFAITQAKFLSDRIEKETVDDTEARIGEYYRVVFQREATEEELQTGLEFITSFEDSDSSMIENGSSDPDAEEPLTGWELYAQTLLLSNELIFVD